MKPDRRLAQEMYRRHAATYDRRVAPAEAIRRRAVARLRLQKGDIVLDVGCGTGLSFRLIEDSIGPEGRLVGIEVSPDMLGKARERVESNRWQNVTLIESPVEEADIPVQADAVLFHFVHDIMRELPALETVFRQVKPAGRVAAAGAKWAPRWRVPVNMAVWYISRQYVTTFEGFDQPWSHLTRFVPDLRVEPAAFGGAYVAWGTTAQR